MPTTIAAKPLNRSFQLEGAVDSPQRPQPVQQQRDADYTGKSQVAQRSVGFFT